MQAEADQPFIEGVLGPMAKAWIRDLEIWYAKLQKHFEFDPSNLAANVRKSWPRWKPRLQYLRKSNEQLYREVREIIREGHGIPFEETPKRFFRRSNPPSLAADKVRAWKAIIKDIDHRAIVPPNESDITYVLNHT